jgi:hypothetical protein
VGFIIPLDAAIMCLSADQLACHVVVFQANLQAFVLQQYLIGIRYLR